LVSEIHPDRDAFLCALGLRCCLLTLLRAATLLHGRSPLHRKWRNREHIASRGRRPSHSISKRSRLLRRDRPWAVAALPTNIGSPGLRSSAGADSSAAGNSRSVPPVRLEFGELQVQESAA